MGTIVGTISALNRYPVKSLGGEPLTEAEVTATGLAGDRTHAFWDPEAGKVVSAKLPRPWGRLLDLDATVAADGTVRVSDGEETWAIDDPALVAALSQRCGRRVEMATWQAGTSYASTWPELGGITFAGDMDLPIALGTEAKRYVDLAALHLLTTDALARVGELAPEAEAVTDVRRYRPNLVIDTGAQRGGPTAGGNASEAASVTENAWVGRTVRIGGSVTIAPSLPTPRCVMTTLPQGDLPRERAGLKALAAHERHDMEGVGAFACLGVYAEVTTPGTVRLGDPVTIDDLGEAEEPA